MENIRIPQWEEVPSEYDNRKEYVQRLPEGQHAGEPYLKASLRSDGCTDYRQVHNIGFVTQDEDYLHICDLDQLIADLIALRMIQQVLEQDGWVY
jgi:hypothetical protein